MISPQAVRLVIRHFDAIDRAVAKRTTRKRPWLETAITSYLCDLMDEETQIEEGLSYSIRDLNRELGSVDGLLDVRLTIDTHEYPPKLEHWVTQADLGFVLSFEDALLPDESWSRAWLLQAKRIAPDTRNPLRYSETSRVSSIDSGQLTRMKRLNEILGNDVVRYLLYCPRPELVDETTRQKLLHLRRHDLVQHIFDYILGLELRGELERPDSTLAAGMFVAPLDGAPRTLGEVHKTILAPTLPFSWFVVTHCFSSGPGTHRGMRHPEHVEPPHPNKDWVRGIVTGDRKAIDRLVATLGEAVDGPWPILPQHTLTVRLGIGTSMDPEHRRIRVQG